LLLLLLLLLLMMLSSVMCRASTELMLTVIQARDLERDHVTGSLDSYVRVSLAPFTGSRSQTRVRKFTFSPFRRRNVAFCADGGSSRRAEAMLKDILS